MLLAEQGNGVAICVSTPTPSKFQLSLPSFGIITHFHFQTYPAPAQPTFFSYAWSLPLDQAIEGIAAYQNFTMSAPIPKEIGVELNLGKGQKPGELSLNLGGSYYGNPSDFAGILTPFLDAMVWTTFPCAPRDHSRG